jgi:hypothetical protein
MCVFVHSYFTKNPPIDLEAINPSFLRWLCHTYYKSYHYASTTNQTHPAPLSITYPPPPPQITYPMPNTPNHQPKPETNALPPPPAQQPEPPH